MILAEEFRVTEAQYKVSRATKEQVKVFQPSIQTGAASRHQSDDINGSGRSA